MTGLVTRSGAWLLQQGAALPDTLVMKTVAAARGWFETVTDIASVIIAITLMVFVVVGAPAAWQIWQTLGKLRAVLEKAHADIGPLAVNARVLAARLGEFNALLKVFQDEAEDVFVSTASTVRGVRTGAATLRGRPDYADDDEGEDEDVDDERDEISDDGSGSGEEHRPERQERGRRRHADGGGIEEGGRDDAAARPRLRSRRR